MRASPSKNYYVVRTPSSGDCKVEPKKLPNDFIMVGKSPYASERSAEAAIATFPRQQKEQRVARARRVPPSYP
jgi:hypothetical protein